MKSQMGVKFAVALLLIVGVAGAPDAHAKVFLAVGTVYGAPRVEEPGLETTPLLLRSTGEDWKTVALPPTAAGGLRKVTFSTPTEAWVVGATGAGPTLFHSDDAGQTWEDATTRLPNHLRVQVIRDVLFLDAERGWLVSQTVAGVGASVSVTLDGGETWAPTRSLGVANATGPFALTRSQDGPALLRAGSDGPELVKVDGARFGERASGVEKASGVFSVAAVASVSDRQWVAGTEAATPEALNDIPSIFSVGPDGTWVAQQILSSRPTELLSIHVATETFGLAAGARLTAPSRPVVFYMHDSGVWKEGALPAGLDGKRASTVLCGDAGRGWLAANVDGAKGMALLTTEDGGVTWSSVATSFETSGHIYGFAASPE